MTTNTMIVSTYDDKAIAGKAIKALCDEGFRNSDIKILQGGADALMPKLLERGFDEVDARGLVESVEQGKILLSAMVSADQADRAASIMDRFETDHDEDQDEGRDASNHATDSLPVVEEEIVVGKAKHATGGVRVTSSVKETPVEETVTLREESVSADRRSADRKLTDQEAKTAFEEKTVEVIATKEEATVGKEARVVGEVAIHKSVDEREETIHGNIRKTDVKVEKIDAKSGKGK